MKYDAVIIGAGTAGLACALRLSAEGRKVLVLERQGLPGGYATTFQRRGFTFESSVHCVDGLEEGSQIRDFLEDTGVAKNIEFIQLNSFARMIYPEHDFILDFNRQDFMAFLQEQFPRQKDNIKRLFCSFDDFYAQFDRWCASRMPDVLKIILGPIIYPKFLRTSAYTVKQLLEGYLGDEKLKAILTDIWRFAGLPPGRLSALYFLLIFRGYNYSRNLYVKGGFIQIFRQMVKRIEDSGSRVMFNTAVNRIITDKSGRVHAVATDKNEEFQADAVISSANVADTLTKMPDNGLIKERYLSKLSSLEKSVSAVQLYLGLSMPAKKLGMDNFMFSINATYDHDDNFGYCLTGDYERCPLELVDHAQVDPGLVPAGKGSLTVMTLDSYSNWDNLRDDEYLRKKKEVADKFILRAQKYLPQLSRYVEFAELATPRTMEKYTLSTQGAIYGFAQTVKQSGINRLPQDTAIKGLFLAGAWTRPGGGVHACFISGLSAAELALRFLGNKKSG
ncbi:MAG: NAD(P)/FAD-dependent oxidoreductase [Candidatus Omnitrophica bacterium]|nr:NAD(P)/FAD-dependent oxidoreductase [Candidatus Omnitrophota bacterium]